MRIWVIDHWMGAAASVKMDGIPAGSLSVIIIERVSNEGESSV
jgi:hypothetical protein